MQQASNHQPVHVFFFLLSCDSCHSEVLLSEEKPAAVVELAVASLGPVGYCLCSDVDVLHRTSGSITLSVLDNSALLSGLPPPPTWQGWDSPKTARHQLQGRDSFLLKVTH